MAGWNPVLTELMAITQEMSRLKSEIYSEQGGLAEKLTELTKQAGALDGAVGNGSSGSSAGSYASGGGGSGGGGGNSGLRRPNPNPNPNPNLGLRARGRDGAVDRPERAVVPPRRDEDRSRTAGRRVEFAPGTPDPMPMRQRYRREEARQGWTPYMIGVCVVCVGPLRPILMELLSYLYTALINYVNGQSDEDDEPAWYDQ